MKKTYKKEEEGVERKQMLVSVRVVPAMRRESVVERPRGGYTIEVRARAEWGEATERARILLAERMGVSEASVRCVKGARTPAKVFSVFYP